MTLLSMATLSPDNAPAKLASRSGTMLCRLKISRTSASLLSTSAFLMAGLIELRGMPERATPAMESRGGLRPGSVRWETRPPE